MLSDYAKGALTPHAIRDIIDAAKSAGIPVIVDPKAVDYSIYRGATVIKPNRKELSDATRRRAETDEDVIAAASELNRLLGTDAVVVSLSDAGLILVPSERRGAPCARVSGQGAGYVRRGGHRGCRPGGDARDRGRL